MKNRDKILKTNLYDFLLSINNPYENACIVENIAGEYIYDEDKSRCWQTACAKDCAKCLERFLNEEARHIISEKTRLKQRGI